MVITQLSCDHRYFGRPLVKRFALSDRCLSVLSVCPVCDGVL